MMKRILFEDEHHRCRASIREFVERTGLPGRDRHREQRAIDREVWLDAGRQGFLGLGVPTDHSGSGVEDFPFNAVVGEELARAGAGYASAFGVHTDAVAPYLLQLTTEEQRARWLPRFCTGAFVSGMEGTEPDTGSDLAALRTTDARDGDGGVINGAKRFVTEGARLTGPDLGLGEARA